MARINLGTKVFKAAQQWQSSFPMVLDRVEGTWVVTGYVTDDDFDETLRLRISFSPEEDTVLFRFDVGFAWGTDFDPLGEAESSCLCGEGIADDDLPELWRDEFREMVRRWAAVTLILEPMDEYMPAAARPEVFSTSESSAEVRQ